MEAMSGMKRCYEEHCYGKSMADNTASGVLRVGKGGGGSLAHCEQLDEVHVPVRTPSAASCLMWTHSSLTPSSCITLVVTF